MTILFSDARVLNLTFLFHFTLKNAKDNLAHENGKKLK
jgi:hypothetical protein